VNQSFTLQGIASGSLQQSKKAVGYFKELLLLDANLRKGLELVPAHAKACQVDLIIARAVSLDPKCSSDRSAADAGPLLKLFRVALPPLVTLVSSGGAGRFHLALATEQI
jgi:hypothetical protein